MSRIFQQSQLHQVQTCWNNTKTNNKFHHDNFFSRLYSNLLINNNQLSSKLYDNDETKINNEASLFKDLFEFLIVHLQDLSLCNEYASQFQAENGQFIKNLFVYAQPMSVALITTLKQWIGNDNVSQDLENLWLKAFWFIIDLVEIESDVDSTFSEERPLQLRNSSPESVSEEFFPLKPDFKSKSNTNETLLSFDINKNDKYKGFRRSVQENYTPNNEPVTIPIPINYTKQSVSNLNPNLSMKLASISEFDPRSSRRSMKGVSSSATSIMTNDTMVTAEPIITPRSHKRNNSDLSKFSQRRSSESDSETESATPVFDPRLRKHVRNNSVDHTNDDSIEEIVIESPRSSPKQTRKSTFESRFGLKSLVPIVETDFDDSASSKYESDDDNSYTGTNTNSEGTDMISSGVSTLSLHDRSSSLSSGTDPMSAPSPDFKAQTHVRTESGSSKVSYMRPLPQTPSPLANISRKHSRSTSSLMSDFTTTGKNRVSMGFLRSSYVLKKEMEDLGFNMPESLVNEDLAPPPRIQMADFPVEKTTSVISFKYTKTMGVSESTIAQPRRYSNTVTTFDVESTKSKTKRSFGSKLKSLFKSKPSNNSKQQIKTLNPNIQEDNLKVNLQEINANPHPYASRYEDFQTDAPISLHSRASRHPSRNSRHTARQTSVYSNYGMNQKTYSDATSIKSSASSLNGFSFFGSSANLHRTESRGGARSIRGNKYQVRSVPYNVFAKGV